MTLVFRRQRMATVVSFRLFTRGRLTIRVQSSTVVYSGVIKFMPTFGAIMIRITENMTNARKVSRITDIDTVEPRFTTTQLLRPKYCRNNELVKCARMMNVIQDYNYSALILP